MVRKTQEYLSQDIVVVQYREFLQRGYKINYND
jgi:hypothetical protein